MKTTVLMRREFFGSEINQRSDNGFFSATDLIRVGNQWRMQNGLPLFSASTYFQYKGTKEFIKKLKESEPIVKIDSRGKGSHTWVHPFLFVDMALNISPDLKVMVYSWIYDELIKYRNDSGDSYKKMAGAVYLNISNKSLFKETIVEYANRIKKECDVDDWQQASAEQLALRDKIQEYVSIFSDVINNNDLLIDIAVKKAKKEMEK